MNGVLSTVSAEPMWFGEDRLCNAGMFPDLAFSNASHVRVPWVVNVKVVPQDQALSL